MQGKYGGCGGNLNRFKTKKECTATCSQTDNGDMDQSSIIKYLQKLEHLMQNIARKVGA